jgi:hypothetical protein
MKKATSKALPCQTGSVGGTSGQRPSGWRRTYGRIPPLTPDAFHDDKILTEWNALAIGALATAARSFDRPDFLAMRGARACFFSSA